LLAFRHVPGLYSLEQLFALVVNIFRFPQLSGIASSKTVEKIYIDIVTHILGANIFNIVHA